MSTTPIHIFLALFLIAHAWIHFSLTTVPLPGPGALHTPFWPSWWRTAVDPTWPASRLGLSENAVRYAGSALWAAALAGFCLAGLGLLGVPGLNLIWRAAAVFASGASLILLAFYWHPWFVAGPVIDIAILFSIFLRWPAALYPIQ